MDTSRHSQDPSQDGGDSLADLTTPASFSSQPDQPQGSLPDFSKQIRSSEWQNSFAVDKIRGDHSRFKQIVKGKIRENLRKFISHGELIGKKGDDVVSIPLPRLDLPHFRFGKNQGGVGKGEGEEGDPLGQPQPGEGDGQAGQDAGQHVLETDVTMDELAEILGEELELPRLEPKTSDMIEKEKHRYTSVRVTGPESLRHKKRTHLRAMKRQISEGNYDPDDPKIIPIKDDKRYRSEVSVPEPHANAVIVYMMDVSGSMSDEMKQIVRTEAFWIDTWIKHHYENVEVRYIIHDSEAKEVDEEAFYHTRESGGTKISSAYELCNKVIEDDFPPAQWNIYAFHFSDGDNWGDDNRVCADLLKEKLLPVCNLFGYGQVESRWGSGEWYGQLENRFDLDNEESLRASRIQGRDGILDSIKALLGK